MSIIILLSYTKYLIKIDTNEIKGVVISLDYKKATIKTIKGDILIYHNNELKLGDYGIFYLDELDYDTELFDYKEYLLNKGIKGYFKLKYFDYKDNYFVIGKIKGYFINKVSNNTSKYNYYIKMLIFGEKDNENIIDETKNLGISHLLAVSGMHISILVGILSFLLKKLFYYEKPIDIIISIFLIIYLFITNFELTILRAVLMFLFSKIASYKKLNFTTLDILSFVGILILFFNPRYLFLLSFQLSFLVSFIIIIFGKNVTIKNKIIQTYLITLVAFLTTIPFILNANYEINLLTIIIGPIYVLYFEILLYPATIILMFFPFLYSVVDYIYLFFESTVSYFSSIKELTFIFGEVSLFTGIIYEVILYFVLVSFEVKRGRLLLSILLIFFLLIIYNKAYFNPFYRVKMYDVGQGDSIIISLPHNNGNILFDCYNNLLDHLKKDGIKDIDVVFLSHGHSDHIDAYIDIMRQYNLKYTYSSYYDSTSLLKDIKQKYKITLLKGGNMIVYKNLTFTILGPLRKYSNENDNSLVVKTSLEDITILFAGDIEREAEMDLINHYGKSLKSDILKAAHHGSKTSTTNKFLDIVKPNYVLISVGRNNRYNFPNNELLLSMENVYRTDYDYSVCIYIRKKHLFIK